MEEKALQSVEQKTIIFYDDKITAVLVEISDKQDVYVPVRPICEFLGISWTGQRRRINRDPVLSRAAKGVNVTFTPGGRQTVVCLPLKYLHGWLFGLTPARANEEVKERLIRYQEECYEVLSAAFLPAESKPTNLTTLEQVRQMGLAITRMAEEQMEFERRLLTNENRLDRAAAVVGDINRRLTAVEQKLSPDQMVTEEKASQISQAVKTVALAAGKKSGRNEFGAVYGELYRKFGITSYKMLPNGRFDEAMTFLTEWYEDLTGETAF